MMAALKRILFLDLATSGLMNDRADLGDPSQPWICAAAAELTNGSGMSLAWPQYCSTMVRSNGRMITAGATAQHGITPQMAERVGVSEVVMLGLLMGLVSQADAVVGWAIDFDRKTIQSEMIRLKRSLAEWDRPGLRFIDLKPIAQVVCKEIDDSEGEGFRQQKLESAFSKLTGEPPPAAGQAHVNVDLAKRIYRAILDRDARHFEFAA